MAKEEKVRTKKVKCLKAGRYSLDPAQGPIVYIEKGTVDFFPLKFAHDMIEAGAFEPADGSGGAHSSNTGDVAERLKDIANREEALKHDRLEFDADKEQMETDQEDLTAARKQFEDDKKRFADIAGTAIDAAVDDDETVDESLEGLEEKSGENTNEEADAGNGTDAQPSVAERCANIVSAAKNEKAAKKALLSFAANNFGLKLNKTFGSTTMTEKIIQAAKAKSENNGE